MTMEWAKLLSRRRLAKAGPPAEQPHRNAFEVDIDRITFSTSFRRLADKQQVHGIGGSDYVRSRLTHSMEAARVGRSLGTKVGQVLVDRAGGKGFAASAADIGHIVAAACLAHDLGTPCFAHTGEDIISDWFSRSDLGRAIAGGLSSQERHELEHFEGNAQGFRTIACLQGWRPSGGLQLTAATLATYSKYPWAAPAEAGESRPHVRKYGFFSSEFELFSEMTSEAGLLPAGRAAWCRHPLAYLVEAADDACYHVVDIEDAVKMRMIGFREGEELLARLFRLDRAEYEAIEDEDRKLIYLRAQAIDALAGIASDAFLAHLPDLMAGKKTPPLLSLSDAAAPLADIEEVSHDRIYRGQQRCETDIVAARTIAALLDAYGAALLERERLGPEGRLARGDASLLETFPGHRRIPFERAGWVRVLVDYIAGMTDRFAIRQAQLIAG